MWSSGFRPGTSASGSQRRPLRQDQLGCQTSSMPSQSGHAAAGKPTSACRQGEAAYEALNETRCRVAGVSRRLHHVAVSGHLRKLAKKARLMLIHHYTRCQDGGTGRHKAAHIQDQTGTTPTIWLVPERSQMAGTDTDEGLPRM